ncbi:internal (core) protein [Enterobacter phage 03_vB_Eclo_IJM]|nr:internal (core) protein [Enterobacter phage 03_vB_Eclo_IJM]
MLDQYGTIWNYVWSGNKSHIKFLKLLGLSSMMIGL